MNGIIVTITIILIFDFALAFARLRSCKGVGNGTSVCIALKNCPSLLQTIAYPEVTSESIKRLQKLTCGFHRDEPRVCCEKDDLLSINLSDENITSYEDHPNFNLLPTKENCGNVNVPIADRIIGGTIPPLLSLPWVARIGYQRSRRGIEFICGGTLISERYVLTAAHCLGASDDDNNNNPILVRVGEYNTTTNPDCSEETGKCTSVIDVGIEKIIPHPNYHSDTKLHDIALIRLNETVSLNSEYIHPVCLPVWTNSTSEIGRIGLKGGGQSRNAFVAGWGSIKWNVARRSTILRYVHIPIVDNAKCESIYDGITVILDTQICAGGLIDKDSCEGDSGGPLIVTSVSMMNYYQVGVVSYGPTRCGTKGLPGIYTRVSAYVPWILDSLEP